ncbi:hypothetical protein [Aliiruegeria lutimaris]|uniref:Uncharacterized protein n=1 Tax=Aliiruegeria lutimaris TaxID=571298 RepID=A0A1G8KJH1_9RHOB|nr:hypothetical protein [Aliiruegeria lutimaris]SDI43597.1 hypothetical protein SAMN04488026_10039 [Aliiruegeria lutimaris]
MTHRVVIVHPHVGDSSWHEGERDVLKLNEEGAVYLRDFATQAEADAYRAGIYDGNGGDEPFEVNPDEMTHLDQIVAAQDLYRESNALQARAWAILKGMDPER